MITLPPVGLSVPLWPWIMWNLWKSRNKLCFDDRSFSEMDVILKSIRDAKEWQAAQTVEVGSRQQHMPAPPATRAPRQISGPSCWVDAAWIPVTETCGIGGIFKGNISPPLPIINFTKHSISSVLMAEAICCPFWSHEGCVVKYSVTYDAFRLQSSHLNGER